MPLFQPGQSGNPAGRPKGSPNKLTKTVREAFQKAFEELQDTPGCDLISWAQADEKNLTAFYQLASKLIPAEIKQEISGQLGTYQAIPVPVHERESDPGDLLVERTTE